jgi:hypothetical protein
MSFLGTLLLLIAALAVAVYLQRRRAALVKGKGISEVP